LNLLEFKTCSCWPSWHDSKRCCVVADQNGKQQTIVSDSKHPYFAQYGTDPTPPQPSPGKPYHGDIKNAYWVNAADLEAGHKLLDDHNHWQTVISVTVKQEPLNSYNLEVDNDHTYFIRGLQGERGIWVHNQDCSCVSATAQILSKGKITEKEALEKLGEWAYPLDLPKVLNSKNTSSGFWHGTYFYTAEEALERASKKQMGTVLQVPGFAHMVTITPLNNKPGMFRVQDTGVGKTYDVDAEWIKKYVSAGVWYEQ
jgi:hedgehog/intein protein splicing region domain protein